jgi:hypothetical protein
MAMVPDREQQLWRDRQAYAEALPLANRGMKKAGAALRLSRAAQLQPE